MINLTAEKIVIKNGIVLTMDRNDCVIKDGAVVISGDKILAVDKTEKIESEHKGDRVINAKGKAIIPGFVNIHLHSWVTKGVGEKYTLERWLNSFVHPQHQALRPDEAYVGSLMSYADSIKSGVTCVLDMYRFMHKAADAAEKLGLRAFLAPIVSDVDDIHEKFADNEKLIRERHGSADGRVNVWCGVDHTDSSAELFMKVRECANKYKVGIHVHSNESIHDIEFSKKRDGKRPIEFLYDCGIPGPDVVLAHCIWLSNREIQILSTTKTNVAHCPVSNMKLADGVAPVPTLMKNGVNVGLASDDTIETIGLDMFTAMKTAVLLHRINEMDATIMSARDVFRMATVNGAKALGMEKELGSIELGKKADIAIIDLHRLHLTPILHGEFSNLLPLLVHAGNGSDVETVIIDGKIVMENRVLKTVDEDQLIRDATEAAEELLGRGKQFGMLPPDKD